MPFLYPKDIYNQLEFDKVLQDLATRCNGDPAKKQMANPTIHTDSLHIERLLREVTCFQETLQESKKLYVSDYQDISAALAFLEKEDSVLEIEDLLEIRSQLGMINTWFNFFTKEKRNRWRALHDALSITEPMPKLLQHFYKIFDEEGEVKSNASDALAKIRKEMRSKSSSLDHAFNGALLKSKDKGYLTDNFESYRNGRRVLAVLAEYKRKVKGIIHDESSTGKTVFIQPEATLALDSELFELQNEERREIRKILRDLCRELRSYRSTLHLNHEVIIAFDMIQAKALQSVALGITSMPKCEERPCFDWQNAYHPLLLLKHRNNRKLVVPFQLRLDEGQRIVIISGPNAGGKTISLKTVGLLCLMHQSGILTPVDDQSVMGVFSQFITDIGDQQSIEQDLSTYTSHLQNMRELTEKADQSTLFLIDEFGSGTEPTIGAAIAESILQRLHYLKAKGVITTHYGNLKILASKTSAIENASMAFDKAELRPTFHLEVGSPGSSFAFEMAGRSGLHPKIIQRAKAKIGKKEGRLDDLLTSLQKEKNELEKKLAAAEKQSKTLEKLVRSYDQMAADLDVRRKKLKLDEKNLLLQQQGRANQDLEKLIREIRETQNLEKAKALASEVKKEKQEVSAQVQKITSEIQVRSRPAKNKKPFEVGDFVRMKMGGMTGMIETIDKKKLTIQAGNMRFDVKHSDVEHSREPIDIQHNKSVNTRMQAVETVHRNIDIRGLRKEEALLRLEQFIDKALVANLTELEIIHGKGNGILKTLVHDTLKSYNIPYEITHPDPEKGGDGLSIVSLN